ncbi:MAG: type II secretion system ATPase GspE [Planctomycetota bacterium]|jgi:general secretion pathway protein E/type IV pilus assembly protein PilB
MKLGEILIREGTISDTQLEEALGVQMDSGERLGNVLLRLGHADEETVYRALAQQTRIPYVDLSETEVEPAVLDRVAVKTVFQKKVMPLDQRNGILRVALSDPLDLAVIDELSLLARARIEPVVGRPSEIDRLIRKYYGVGADEVHRMVDAAREEVQVVREEGEEGHDVEGMAEDAALIKFVNQVFTEAVRDRASDIHIEPMEDQTRIRYRIDGVLHRIPVPPEIRHFHPAIVSRIKIMSNLDIAEKRLPQDGRIKLKVIGREIDIRVSVIPNVWGEGVVLRILDRESMRFSLEALGMSPWVLGHFERLIEEPHGILLVTGPTGSGKTTTLYAGLEKINSEKDKIVTVEDPVEYMLPGIKQIQIRPKIGMTFAHSLRAILRHDPDIIMIGEIRDLETAEVAVQSSLTGHLVFSTLHTNDAPSAVTRLIDMGLEPFLVASTIEGLMAQRLVRTICKKCKEETKPTKAELADPSFPDDVEKVWHGKGCDTCRGTGYRGRAGLFELVVIDDDIRDMVLRRESSNRIKKVCVDQGMRTLRMDGWERVRQGMTTPAEVIRITKADKF